MNTRATKEIPLFQTHSLDLEPKKKNLRRNPQVQNQDNCIIVKLAPSRKLVWN